MILLLDNYDSFVHNLARYLRQAGVETVVIRSDQIDVAGCQRLRPEGIVLSPGPKRPEDIGCCVEVIRQYDPAIPILGVCLGHQAIAVALGGGLVQSDPVHGLASMINHDGRDLFARCPHPTKVGRYHSLVIDPQTLPNQLEVTARCQDGLIMGVRHVDRPLFGVQFHPESILSDDGQTMIDNFVAITTQAKQPSTRLASSAIVAPASQAIL